MSRGRRRIARLVDRLVESSSWDTTRVLLGRYPELVSQDAEDRLAEVAESAAEDGNREAAAVYQFHRELIRRGDPEERAKPHASPNPPRRG